MAASSLKRSQQDPRAFGDFYSEHAAAVARHFARRVIDPEAALDLTAETFAQAYLERPEAGPEELARIEELGAMGDLRRRLAGKS